MIAESYGKNIRFLRTIKLSSKMAVLVCIPIGNEWESLLFHILATVWGVGHSNRCRVEFFCLNSHFPNNIWFGVYLASIDFLWWCVMTDFLNKFFLKKIINLESIWKKLMQFFLKIGKEYEETIYRILSKQLCVFTF